MTLEELRATLLAMVDDIESITKDTIDMCECPIEECFPCTCTKNGISVEVTIRSKR